MNVPAKETLYKTAFSPMYNVYVSIKSAHQDDTGEWIFKCSSNYDIKNILNDVLFRKNELSNFCL